MGVPGAKGDSYVPLTDDEAHRGYAVVAASGNLQPPPVSELPINVDTGQPLDLPDTPFNRAWIAACQTLAPDTPKATSFSQRILPLPAIAGGRDYAKYRDDNTGTLEVALIAALARTAFSHRTTPKPLRAAFAAEVKRQVAWFDEVMTEAMTEPDFHHQDVGSTSH